MVEHPFFARRINELIAEYSHMSKPPQKNAFVMEKAAYMKPLEDEIVIVGGQMMLLRPL